MAALLPSPTIPPPNGNSRDGSALETPLAPSATAAGAGAGAGSSKASTVEVAIEYIKLLQAEAQDVKALQAELDAMKAKLQAAEKRLACLEPETAVS